MIKKSFILLFILLIILLSTNLMAEEISFYAGEVKVERDNKIFNVKTLPFELKVEDKIIVDKDSRAEITFPSGNVIILAEETNINWNELQLMNAEQKQSAWYENIWTTVERLTTRRSELEQETSTATAAVRGDEDYIELYWKEDKIELPTDEKILQSISILEEMLVENEKLNDETISEIKYTIAQCYIQVEDIENAKNILNEIIIKYPDTDYGEDAKKQLELLETAQ